MGRRSRSLILLSLKAAIAHVPKPSASEIDLTIENLKTHNSPGTDQIPAEVIKAGGRTIHSEIHKLFNSVWNKEELPTSGRSQSLYLPIITVT